MKQIEIKTPMELYNIPHNLYRMLSQNKCLNLQYD